MKLPTPLELETLDWFSRRKAVRRSTVPLKFRAAVRAMLRRAEDDRADAWVDRSDVVLVEATDIGRALAAAYRHGRAALDDRSSSLEAAE